MTDINSALRSELEAALDVLAPQIRGIDDLIKLPMSEELRGFVQTELDDRIRRRGLIEAVIDELDNAASALDELNADGYPALPKGDLPPADFEELKAQLADIMAAFNEFEEVPPATELRIDLGSASPKA